MKYGIVGLAIVLSGCAGTSPKISWVASVNVDEFTDKKTCSVSVGSLYTKSSVFTYSNHYYPYIEVVDNDLRVGIKSGGNYRIPVGNIQIRIDNNDAWTINTSETPLDYAPQASTVDFSQYVENLPEESRKQAQRTYDAAMEGSARAMSPFTAATGEKARAILDEMVNGKEIKYRTIGMNQAASTTGEYALDASLPEALSKCGIKA